MADALRASGTEPVLGCSVKAPSTLGTFLRSFSWGHVRQLDRVSRELLARAWATGGGPGNDPLTIDLDSTVCETYGLSKEGAQRHNYTGQRGYHPAVGHRCGHRRRPDGPTEEGQSQHGARCRPFPARDREPRALHRSHRTTHGAGRQRLLHPRHRRRLPQDERSASP